MTSPTLTILDVGHGCCAILVDEDETIILDAGGYGSPLAGHLIDEGLTHVSTVLLSHSDADHIAGLRAVLSQPEISIGQVRLNSDHLKESDAWRNLIYALSDARRRGDLDFQVGLTAGQTFNSSRVVVEVLSPDPATAALRKRPGSVEDLIDANSMSAVIRLSVDGKPSALVTGDIDGGGLAELVKNCPSPNAAVLIWPHHGGWPGVDGDAALRFAQELCNHVKPRVIVFSFDRTRYENPRPELVKEIRKLCPDVWIACTQLSTHCSLDPAHSTDHLVGLAAKGRDRGHCCIGSLLVDLDTLEVVPVQSAHAAFISRAAESPLCR